MKFGPSFTPVRVGYSAGALLLVLALGACGTTATAAKPKAAASKTPTAAASPVSSTVLARGTATELVTMKPGAATHDVVISTLVIQPGANTGWHTHPGPATAIIKTGAVTFYAGADPTCTGRRLEAGSVYVDPGYGYVHTARNEGSVPVEILVTYLGVPKGAKPRIDAAPTTANCAF